ncbi:2961_t:CDS:10 [Entrophospora sp. SA101]|nr:2961_t:CDS:10 [Entrophospora sp. SA101]
MSYSNVVWIDDPFFIKRQRVQIACSFCRQRKIRCDGITPCGNCQKYSTNCVKVKLERPSRGAKKNSNNTKNCNDSDNIDKDINEDEFITTENINATDKNNIFSTATNALNLSLISSSSFNYRINKRPNDDHDQLPQISNPINIMITEPKIPLLNKNQFFMPNDELFEHLLDLYWTNVHPNVPVLNKSLFLQQLNGPNDQASPLLLNAMFAISSDFSEIPSVRLDSETNESSGWLYFDRARNMLDDFLDAPRMSTIAALILMSIFQQRNTTRRSVIPAGYFQLRKRLWWSLFMLDVLVCCGIGKTSYIDELDCTISDPNVDMIDEPELRNSSALIERYITSSFDSFLKCSHAAANIMPIGDLILSRLSKPFRGFLNCTIWCLLQAGLIHAINQYRGNGDTSRVAKQYYDRIVDLFEKNSQFTASQALQDQANACSTLHYGGNSSTRSSSNADNNSSNTNIFEITHLTTHISTPYPSPTHGAISPMISTTPQVSPNVDLGQFTTSNNEATTSPDELFNPFPVLGNDEDHNNWFNGSTSTNSNNNSQNHPSHHQTVIESMSGEDLNSIKRRRVARACDTCRRKKVRCDGVQPGSDPPSCYIEALETRLQRMESVLSNLIQSGELPESSINSNLEWINSYSSYSNNLVSNDDDDDNDKHNIKYRSTNNQPSDSEESYSSDSNECGNSHYDLNDSMGQLAIDESGHTRYLGSSSGIFLLKFTKKVAHGQMISIPSNSIKSKRNDKNLVIELPPKELCDALLNIYWNKLHPYVPFIDKSEVMEKYNNLETNFPSVILLYSIFALASKYIDDTSVRSNPDDPITAGVPFYERAKEIIKDEFETATITTVQALLLLSIFYQGDKGSTPWIYVGLAIRLAQDMGLHRDSSKWNLDERQIELRKRIWWVCVLLDRFISTALGRPFAINDSDYDIQLPIQDKLPEDPEGSVESLIQMIKLSLIFGQVLSHVYGIKHKHSSHKNNDSVLASLDGELNEWRDNLPKAYQCDSTTLRFGDLTNSRRTFLHLLYYTIQILLHRPHIRGPKSKAPPSAIPSLTICTMAANNITHILYRTMKDGGLGVTWQFNIYPFFTAVSTHIINALSGDDRFREVAKQGLRMSLKCLEDIKSSWYAGNKCISLINDVIRDYNTAMIQQHMINHLVLSNQIITNNNNQNTSPNNINSHHSTTNTNANFDSNVNNLNNNSSTSSPESNSSTSSTSLSYNEYLLSDPLFPTNADAFAPDVSSFLFDDVEDHMGNNNPILPPAIDWRNWSDWAEYLIRIQAIRTASSPGANTNHRYQHQLQLNHQLNQLNHHGNINIHNTDLIG